MKKIQVTEDVANILRRSKIEGNKLTLPDQLARPDYQKVMKVIESAGGKWSKKDKCHIFSGDPSDVFSEALASGVISDRSERAVRTEKQAFYTPQGVADKVIMRAWINEGDCVLEPSAGLGMLALTARDSGGDVTCVELDPSAVAVLQNLKGLGVISGDFLAQNPKDYVDFDRVVMNPPFTKGQDVDHVTHALHFLKPGGVLVAIMSRSFEHHSGRKFAAFRDLLAERGEIVERLSNGEFKESGTAIDTVIVRIVKS